MLFWLEGDIVRVPEALSDAERRLALSNLVQAGRMGRHALSGERDFLLALAESGMLEAQESAYLCFIANALSQDGFILREARKIRVNATDPEVVCIKDGWKVPLGALSHPNLLERPFVIFENIKDAKFFIASAEILAANVLPGFTLSLLAQGGGGDTTWETVAYLSGQSGPPFVCFVDSDCRDMASAVGQTARKCLQALSPNPQWCREVKVLPSRMAENLIPHEMRGALLEGMSTEHRTAHEVLKVLDSKVFLYVDIKKGDSLCRFYIGEQIAGSSSSRDEISCHYCGRNHNCGEIPAFGGILARTLDAIEANSISFPSHKDWSAELTLVAERIVSLGFSRPAARAV